MEEDEITRRILEAAFKVHSGLGAGLLESTYQTCLQYELLRADIAFQHQVRLPINYGGLTLDGGYRIDFLVEERVIVELKSVERFLPLHTAQVLTYLKLSGRRVGLLINFNVPHLRDGIRRVVNGYGTSPLSSVSSVSPVVESVLSIALDNDDPKED